MPKSTAKATRPKPHPDYPLFHHASGRWAKKVRGSMKYFGKVADDPEGETALQLWLDTKDDLIAGRTPRPKSDELRVWELLDRFIVSKRSSVDSGELTQRAFGDYFATCERIIAAFGRNRAVADLGPDDFRTFRTSMAKGRSPVTLANEIQRVRVVFNYGAKNLNALVSFGSEFNRPPKKVLRKNKREKGKRMIEAYELPKVIEAASIPLKAMILLGANAGLGNTDCARLTFSAVDLKTGWVDYARPKTEVQRRFPLWPETIAAIKAAIAERPKHKSLDLAETVFITKRGAAWGSVTFREAEPETGKKARIVSDDPISKEFTKVLTKLGMKRPGLSFYALRHGFETMAGSMGDQQAVDAIMGHDNWSTASTYREESDDPRIRKRNNERLQAVIDYVHDLVFTPPANAEQA
jgi:integrase